MFEFWKTRLGRPPSWHPKLLTCSVFCYTYSENFIRLLWVVKMFKILRFGGPTIVVPSRVFQILFFIYFYLSKKFYFLIATPNFCLILLCCCITYFENLICLASVIKKFKFWKTRLKNPLIAVPKTFVIFYIFVILTYLENFMCLLWVVKNFGFSRTRLRGASILVPPNFVKSYLFLYLLILKISCV